MAEVEERAVIKHPPGALTTPCSLLALHNWMKDAHASAPGVGLTAQVATTATTIAVT
jgi:hypothetical protein